MEATTFEARSREVAADLAALLPDADRHRRFPREALGRLASSDLLRERWAAPDARLGTVLAEELGRAGTGGVGLGVTVHLEAALGTLLRYGATPYLREVAESALRGDTLLAVAATEDIGSNLAAVSTELLEEGDELRVRGPKRYVSLGLSADQMLVTCRGASGNVSLVLVPRAGVSVDKRLRTVGVRAAETVRLHINARVPRQALVGRPGAGVLALSWGLTHERLATAALSTGTAALAVGLATAHLSRRRGNRAPLLERQALRLRLAEDAAHVDVMRRAVHSLAAVPLGTARGMREAAGLKATAARVMERVVSNCMHLFGGAGYAEDESPLGRLWLDVRAARMGGGTDEMMWELVAGGLVPADDAYDRMVEGAR